MPSQKMLSWIKRKQKICRRTRAKACRRGSPIITRKKLSEFQAEKVFTYTDASSKDGRLRMYWDTSKHQLGPVYVRGQ